MQAGLRRAATGLLPSRRIQDVLSINDGEGNRHSFIILLAIATQKRYSCLPMVGISGNNLKEALIYPEIS